MSSMRIRYRRRRATGGLTRGPSNLCTGMSRRGSGTVTFQCAAGQDVVLAVRADAVPFTGVLRDVHFYGSGYLLSPVVEGPDHIEDLDRRERCCGMSRSVVWTWRRCGFRMTRAGLRVIRNYADQPERGPTRARPRGTRTGGVGAQS